jgi:phosphatidylglycerol:prolipoprotein diacylglycerol transferase
MPISPSASPQAVSDVPLYPVQLIESACLLALWLVLVWAYPRRRKDGAVFALYLVLYPPIRFALEYLRGDERQSWLALDVAQVTSIGLFLAGILLLVFLPRRRYAPPRPAADFPRPPCG